MLILLVLIFAVASLAVQIVAYKAVKDGLTKVQNDFTSIALVLNTRIGTSVWLTVGAVAALAIAAFVNLIGYCLARRTRHSSEEQIGMSRM